MEEVGVPDPIGDIIAIRQIQEEIKQSRLWRVDQASEGFGETLDQSVDAMKEEQGIQALDHLTKQYGGMARLESEQQGGLLEILDKHIAREDNNLSLWTNQCQTMNKAFDSYEVLMDKCAALHVPISPRTMKSGSSGAFSPRQSSPNDDRVVPPRASQLNFGAIRNRRQKVKDQTDELVVSTELLDTAFSRLQQNAALESTQKGLLRIAVEHLTLPYFYELAAYGEWRAEHMKQKQANETAKEAAKTAPVRPTSRPPTPGNATRPKTPNQAKKPVSGTTKTPIQTKKPAPSVRKPSVPTGNNKENRAKTPVGASSKTPVKAPTPARRTSVPKEPVPRFKK